jgi:hypothetical protein
VCCSYSDYTNT